MEKRESGVKWVGEIPSHWKVKKGKYCLTYVEKPTLDTDEVITCFRDGEVTLRSNRREDGFTISLKEIGYQGIDVGDLVVHGMDGFAGAIGISDSRGKASPVLNVLDTDNDKRFIMYYLRNMAYNGVFLALSTGIRVRTCDTNWGKLRELPYVLPPIEEQHRIADYLEQKCNEIDSLIGDIGKQIGLLEQYKKSIITEVVTKGLNPYVDMKDSGIEWIGLIPKHWKVLRIKNLGTARNGLTYSPTDTVDEEHGTLVLRSSNVQNGRIVLDDNVYVSTRISDELMVRKGDILICSRNGSRELIGKNALIEDVKATYGAFMMVYRCIAPKFLYYVLNSDVFSYYLGSFFTSTINQLTGANFNNMKIVFCPDELERNEITKYLDDKCAAIDEVLSKKHQQIEILTEYKKSLIYEYVTGKKEVS